MAMSYMSGFACEPENSMTFAAWMFFAVPSPRLATTISPKSRGTGGIGAHCANGGNLS
jgi:hypothetical protein